MFIDCIAIGNVLPAPLVIFATFVGFQGGYRDGGLGAAFAGAVVITLGMFMPCFLFTVAGHEVLERIVRNKVCCPRLCVDGGLIGVGTGGVLRWPVWRGDWCYCCYRLGADEGRSGGYGGGGDGGKTPESVFSGDGGGGVLGFFSGAVQV